MQPELTLNEKEATEWTANPLRCSFVRSAYVGDDEYVFFFQGYHSQTPIAYIPVQHLQLFYLDWHTV